MCLNNDIFCPLTVHAFALHPPNIPSNPREYKQPLLFLIPNTLTRLRCVSRNWRSWKKPQSMEKTNERMNVRGTCVKLMEKDPKSRLPPISLGPKRTSPAKLVPCDSGRPASDLMS